MPRGVEEKPEPAEMPVGLPLSDVRKGIPRDLIEMRGRFCRRNGQVGLGDANQIRNLSLPPRVSPNEWRSATSASESSGTLCWATPPIPYHRCVNGPKCLVAL